MASHVAVANTVPGLPDFRLNYCRNILSFFVKLAKIPDPARAQSMSILKSTTNGGGIAAVVRILLIGGQPADALAAQMLLEAEGYELRHRFLAAEAIGILNSWEPSLVMLCLEVSDMDGNELCRSIREKYAFPILAVAATPDEEALVRALDEGADDVLSLPLRGDELKAHIRALVRRSWSAEIHAPQIACGALRIDGARRKATVDGEPVALTRTEFDILLFLAVRRGSVQPQEAILRAVWGLHHGQYVQTLRVHVGHIRQKIEADPSRPTYILTEPGIGYLSAEPNSKALHAAHR